MPGGGVRAVWLEGRGCEGSSGGRAREQAGMKQEGGGVCGQCGEERLGRYVMWAQGLRVLISDCLCLGGKQRSQL